MKIGIIGGVSPYASSDFYLMLCKQYRLLFGYYPELILYSIKVDETIEQKYLNGTATKNEEALLYQQMQKACDLFANNSVECVTIICNSLSCIFEKATSDYSFKLVVTPMNCMKKYLEYNKDRVLLLSTRYTKNILENYNILQIKHEEQDFVETIIATRINGGDIGDHLLNKLHSLISSYSPQAVLLGCTDLSSKDITLNSSNVVDSVVLVVDEILNWCSHKCAE